MIRVANLRNLNLKKGEVLIKIDRSSVLGNPYYMKDESMRDEVCDKYVIYFNKKLNDLKFMIELKNIYKLSKSFDIVLGCWCYPKRCHGLTVKLWIESYKGVSVNE